MKSVVNSLVVIGFLLSREVFVRMFLDIVDYIGM